MVDSKPYLHSECPLNRSNRTLGQVLGPCWRISGIQVTTPTLIALLLCAFAPQDRPGAAANAVLEKLAADALALPDTTGRTRLSIADGVITYDFRPVAASSLANKPDCLTDALALMVRSAALRRDFQAVLPKETFWAAPFNQIDLLAKKMVDRKFASANDAECRAKQQPDKAAAETEFMKVETALRGYAAKSGLGTVGARGLAEGYRVEVRVDPGKARIRFMPFLDYKRCMYFNLPLEEHWNELTPGIHNLIGHYRYRAEWPAELNGPEEGNLDITGNTRITFTPKAN
jgi:hypothetical protein